jgi:xylulokinase
MNLLGLDIGSSSVKASIVSAETGECLASAFYPKEEMKIDAPAKGWAEQHPQIWWVNLKKAVMEVMATDGIDNQSIKAIGVSYQMHGLVMLDKQHEVLRPSIIWCDSRAVETGNTAFQAIGGEKCLASLLNSPGNFTASKLKWVKDHEPNIYEKADKIMLPGDYIAFLLTGEVRTTSSGLSEGIFWDFKNNQLSDMLMQHYGFENHLIPELVPNIGEQGQLTSKAAEHLGLPAGIPVTYRSGDQPNNAFSLNVLNPGEIAATAGTSGVVFGVSDQVKYDPLSRVNTFAHVNHSATKNRLGVLLCVNGTGITNAWIKRNAAGANTSYDQMNELAAAITPGSEGIRVFPFGNGAERIMQNKDTGCVIEGVDFNRHDKSHLFRAAQEGIVFAFMYGIEVMRETGIEPKIIRAGNANMFLSPVFRESFAALTNSPIELYNTDGSQGAARAAGLGAGIFANEKEAFKGLKVMKTIDPDPQLQDNLMGHYAQWKQSLENKISQ